MSQFFLEICNMSLIAGCLVPVILLLRFLLKKAPRHLTIFMWAAVAIRLICPFSFESVLSLLPSANPIPQEILTSPTPSIQSGVAVIDDWVNPVISQTFSPQIGASVNPMQILTAIAAHIWVIGILGMLLYALFSCLNVAKRVREAVQLQENIYLCDHIDTPFIFGIIRPKIYLPSHTKEEDIPFVIAHEKAHLQRKDHFWKPFAYLLLTVYWFNPLLWVGYLFLCRDIEAACDEKVLQKAGDAAKKPYSEALINASAPKNHLAICPLAFGETAVKSRIRQILHYKKPAFWLIALALVACVVLGVCFLTNPDTLSLADFQKSDFFHYVDQVTFSDNRISLQVEGKTEIRVITDLLARIRLKKQATQDVTVNEAAASFSLRGVTFFASEGYTHIWWAEGNGKSAVYAVTDPALLKDVFSPLLAEKAKGKTPLSYASKVAYVGWSDKFEANYELHGNLLYLFEPIQTKGELDVFLQGQRSYLQMDITMDKFPSFSAITDEYTDDFFADNALLFVYVSANSTSWRYDVQQIVREGSKLTVTVNRTDNNESGDTAMAGWVIVAEVKKEEIAACKEFVTTTDDLLFQQYENQELAEQYLCYFGLDTKDGLVVYGWEMAPNTFFCGLLPDKARGYEEEELWTLPGVSVATMQEILASYDIPAEKIRFEAISMIYSNYIATDSPEEQTKRLKEQFASSAKELPPVSLTFSSGHGGWSTTLKMLQDGSFTGLFMDSDTGDVSESYPQGTRYICNFSGIFEIVSSHQHTISLRLVKLVSAEESGKEWYEDDVRYIASTPYGLDGETEFVLYLPDTPTDALPQEATKWLQSPLEKETIGCYALYCPATGYTFFND